MSNFVMPWNPDAANSDYSYRTGRFEFCEVLSPIVCIAFYEPDWIIA